MKEIIVFILSAIKFLFFKAGVFRQEKRVTCYHIEELHDSQFEGVKIIMGIKDVHIISALSLSKKVYQNPSMMMRVAKAIAQSQVCNYLNDTNFTRDITKAESLEGTKPFTLTMKECIGQNESGFAIGLELLSNLEIDNGDRMHFIYAKKYFKEFT